MKPSFDLNADELRKAVAEYVTRETGYVCMAGDVILAVELDDRSGSKIWRASVHPGSTQKAPETPKVPHKEPPTKAGPEFRDHAGGPGC